MQHRSPLLSGPGHAAVSNAAKSAPVQALGCQLIQENAVGDNVKGFAELQMGITLANAIIPDVPGYPGLMINNAEQLNEFFHQFPPCPWVNPIWSHRRV
ncbi:hypothetical protein DUI87_00745 [Hirundo rustica rustica]|uniref:Uncharacterized protein n=1 Tax=Hirundo rustica rustica TaxID=333673 RepID=A0A3M0LBC2_HIRRU|nr:hypothetical protein DUI87_00745 [Hirundo rustica rustica]